MCGWCGLGTAWAGAGLAVWAFFLPWIRLEASQPGQRQPIQTMLTHMTRVGKVDLEVRQGDLTVSGTVPELSSLPVTASGFQIPAVANRQDVVAAVAFTEMLTGHRHLGPKSYLVYLLPGLAVVAVALLTAARSRWICLATALACLIAAAIGFLRLAGPQPELLTLTVWVERGLWLSCWAYVVVGAGALVVAGTRS